MDKIDEILERMSGYICDELCRHGSDRKLCQQALEDVCKGCEIGRFMNSIRSECSQAIPSEIREDLWKGNLMQRFMARS